MRLGVHIVLVYFACIMALILGLAFQLRRTIESFEDASVAPPLTAEQINVVKTVIDDKAAEINKSIEDKVKQLNKTIDDKNNDLASWAVTAIY